MDVFGFFSTHIFQIFGLVASLGAIGIGVLIFVVGIPAMMILANVVGFFKEVAKWFSTPTGQAVGIIILLLLAFLVGDIHRARIDAAVCETKIADLKAEQKAAEAAIRKKVSDDADARIAAIRADTQTLDQKELENERTLPRDNSCAVTPDDLDRMRKLGIL